MSIKYKIIKFFKSVKKAFTACISDDIENTDNIDIDELIGDTIHGLLDIHNGNIEDGVTEIMGIVSNISGS